MAGKLIKGAGALIPAAVFDARREAEALRAEARAQGLEAARAEATGLVVRALVDAARVRADAAGDLTALARRIAEKLLGRELALRPDAVADVARLALAEARGAHELVVRAHPDDLAALEAARPRLRAELALVPEVRLHPDPSVGRGGCIVETESGSVDARLETQLDAIERAMTPSAPAAAKGPA